MPKRSHKGRHDLKFETFLGQTLKSWKTFRNSNKIIKLGVSTGLVVKGGDSCREFESQCRIPDGSFLTFICCVKIALMSEKTSTKDINEKEADNSPFLTRSSISLHLLKLF